MATPNLRATSTNDVPWYQPSLPDNQIPPATYDLLENYSRIPRASIDAHVTTVREKAWSIFPYPCIGQWRFLDLSISQHPAYARVLAMLKEGQYDNDTKNKDGGLTMPRTKLLDLGCCFAQDIRKLIYDGAPADSLYACDLKSEFLDLGFDLFSDRESCQAHFFAADVLREDDDSEGGETGLAKVAGDIDVIYAASFFHIFSWDDQVRIAMKIVKVLRPQRGSLLFGRQTGNIWGREVENKTLGVGDKATIWRHDVDSFGRLWKVVGELTESKWDVWAEFYDTPNTTSQWAEEGIRMMRFEVTRQE